MEFQRRLSNGDWIDESRVEMFCQMVLERETWYAPRVNREPMTTVQQVVDFLAAGHEIRFDNDWYAEIRDADAITAPKPVVVEMFTCNCGHRINKKMVMSTSRGSSCPDCYDRMSD